MNETLKKELYVAIHGQSTRFRIVKYAILLPLFAFIYWKWGGEMLLKTLGILFVIAIGVHLLYRWKTDAWTRDWGGYRSLFKSASEAEVVVVNEKDEVIGTMLKSTAHRDGTPHRIAVTYVENPSREFLVQVRADGLLDHSAAGHVDPGESYEEAARRELSEELGISDKELKRIGHARTTGERYGEKLSSHVFDIFVCTAEPGELQADEVHSVYWAKSEDVLKDMEANREKYCGGFIASLAVYVQFRASRSQSA